MNTAPDLPLRLYICCISPLGDFPLFASTFPVEEISQPSTVRVSPRNRCHDLTNDVFVLLEWSPDGPLAHAKIQLLFDVVARLYRIRSCADDRSFGTRIQFRFGLLGGLFGVGLPTKRLMLQMLQMKRDCSICQPSCYKGSNRSEGTRLTG
uniref:Uncharacterized protein n=1 Tax=Caenorhabditis japonica TaxID=281687 RepID=A0A8R1EKE7_CAEJA